MINLKDDVRSAHEKAPKERSLKCSALIIIGITFCLIALLVWYGLSLSQKVKGIEDQWSEFNREAAAASYALGRIEASFGYGGFIHHFKNYVLRQDSRLIPVIENNLQATYKAIVDYPISDEHSVAREALEKIKKVVDIYALKFTYAQKMVSAGASSNIIDVNLQVNDRPALEAIRFLNNHVISHRLDKEKQTNEELANTLQFLNRGAFLIPLLLIAGGILIFFMRKIVTTNRLLASTSQHMSDIFNAAPDAMLIINTKGIIEEVNRVSVELFGYNPDELIGEKVEKLMPERFRSHHPQLVDDSFDKPVRRPLNDDAELTALTKDGDELPVEISLSYTLREGSMYAITTLRDIRERKETQNKLRRNEDVMRKAQTIAHFGSWEWDVPNNTLAWSDEVYRIFGLRPQQFEATYEAFLESLHPEDKENVVNAVNAAVVYDQPYDIQHRVVQPDGNVRFVHQRGEVFRNDQGDAMHMVGTVRDISKEKKAVNEMRLADNVFSHSSEAILVTDTENNILRVNEAFTDMTGYSKEEALGKNPKDLLNSGHHDKAFYRAFWRSLIETGGWDGEIMDRRKNGETFPAHHSISVVKNDLGEIIQFISIFSDVTEEKRAAEHIQNLAQYDQLTKLPNRMLFNDRLQHAITRATRAKKIVGLMFIDLDRFKSVNDTLGHHAGDLLLQEVSKRLSGAVRLQDTVARLGGDEFTIILEDLAHAEDAAIVSDKLLAILQEKVVIDGNDIFIGGSIGISIFPTDGENIEDIVKRADMAMYQAKQQGRNRYRFYTDELAQFAEKRFQVENRLRQAIDGNELEVYYQPQVDISTGTLVGAEALVRWNDPEKGLVSPADFIPIAEETGLIEPLGDWVLKAACQQAKKWQDEGFDPFRMTVNVAGYQILQGSIVESTRTVLEETGLASEFLELEITEGFVMDHSEKGVLILEELRKLGVSLVIDDFGTGYSSLSYLKRLPIDRLKIDRSFVMDIPHDKDDEAIVSSIIAIANNLGLTVIAEGVETEDQIRFLSGQVCFEVQGFYFSKPIPGIEFSRLFLSSQDIAKQHLIQYTKGEINSSDDYFGSAADI